MNRIRGRNAATAATAGNAAATLWNPHSTLSIIVREITVFATTAPAAGSTVAVQRVTARGTATTSVTAALANDTQNGAAATSGAILDLAYSAQPTAQGTAVTNSLWGFMLASVIGSGFVQPFPEGLRIGPGQGLALLAGAAIIVPVCEVGFAFDE